MAWEMKVPIQDGQEARRVGGRSAVDGRGSGDDSLSNADEMLERCSGEADGSRQKRTVGDGAETDGLMACLCWMDGGSGDGRRG